MRNCYDSLLSAAAAAANCAYGTSTSSTLHCHRHYENIALCHQHELGLFMFYEFSRYLYQKEK